MRRRSIRTARHAARTKAVPARASTQQAGSEREHRLSFTSFSCVEIGKRYRGSAQTVPKRTQPAGRTYPYPFLRSKNRKASSGEPEHPAKSLPNPTKLLLSREQTPLHLTRFPMSGEQTPLHLTRFPMSGEQTSLHLTRFPMSGEQTPLHMTRFPMSGEQTPLHLTRFPMSGKQTPLNLTRFPMSGKQTPLSGEQTPLSRKQTSLSRKQTSLSRKQTMLSGKQTFLSSEQTTLSSEQTHRIRKVSFPAAAHIPSQSKILQADAGFSPESVVNKRTNRYGGIARAVFVSMQRPNLQRSSCANGR